MGKQQVQYVKDTFGPNYKKRSLLAPVLIGFAALVLYIGVLYFVALS